ncbi:ABC transporter substrate-binding protein [Curtobacterium sp. MCSS17_007]|uniref:ABC transporter substrate-binding protein n=1 Tax=Curtobacterium sp. MCSS17_007 TaxID=2175646 RepID=UPI0015E89C6D|nr:ABC transporter substrate-binding protein [Curtobacterium sp. MCSS17_007]WIE75582.1 ABC transporter substrate-binding protein [Curtobacterium sp. MCSS17_007]
MPFPLSPLRRRSTLAGGLAAALLVVLTGCGASEAVPQASDGPPAGEGTTTYPVTLQNCGHEVTVDEAPRRIVSLDQNSTEILLSLGLADRMVGTASWTDPVLPRLAADAERVPRLSDDAPSYEVLLGARPDFVTASFGRHYGQGGVATRERLAETGTGSYLSPTDCDGDVSINGGGKRTNALTVDALYQEIHELATLFDVQSRGDALVADLRERAAAATGSTDFGGQRAFFWFADTKTPYVAGGLGSAALLAEQTGLRNVFATSRDDWPAVGWEQVVAADPEVIVLGDLQRDRFPGDRLADKVAFLEHDPLTKDLDAVRHHRFVALHGAELNPSIRFVDGLEKLADWRAEHGDDS